MVVRGKVMNVPSDGKERKVSSAVLVLNGPDEDETIGDAQARPAPPALRRSARRGDDAATLDPGSTGGLLQAMASGAFGPPVDLPRQLRRGLRAFEASR